MKVGGVISTKYIENCYVEAKDSIYVETGILHSMIYTQNMLEMENVRFWLNKEKDKIDVETYKADLFLQPIL